MFKSWMAVIAGAAIICGSGCNRCEDGKLRQTGEAKGAQQGKKAVTGDAGPGRTEKQDSEEITVKCKLLDVSITSNRGIEVRKWAALFEVEDTSSGKVAGKKFIVRMSSPSRFFVLPDYRKVPFWSITTKYPLPDSLLEKEVSIRDLSK